MIKKTKQKRFLLNCYFITIILYFLVLKVNHSFNKIIHLYTCFCYLHTVVCQTSYSNSIFQALIPAKIDLSHISFWKTMTELRSGWTYIQKMYENVDPTSLWYNCLYTREWNAGKVFQILSGHVWKSLVTPTGIWNWGCNDLFLSFLALSIASWTLIW